MKSKRKKILTKRLYIIYNDKINIYNTIIILLQNVVNSLPIPYQI